ncbi:anthrone oxygenase family protein [Mycobacteroides sp. LB1]|uniref:anthrone oxygenase family protein n=1 Tax=Mycobacteroides sp. LB1 TaxID=2750814 RepID=UPI0015E03F7F|nr:DUF1772 domain-containing protein [Mycobacteroides sp. LB1]
MNTKASFDVIDGAAVLLNGTLTGLLFAFSAAVMPALGQQTAVAGAATMQSINRMIVNPVFLVVFLGSALCAVAAGVLAMAGSHRSWWIVAGATICFVGTFVVTVVFNIPLNGRLDMVDVNSVDGQQFWRQYLSQWTAWNHLRVASGIVGTALLVTGLVRR